ncbi:serine hydroxymethyltransferase [Candidatus Jorgensenbacteria bacterium CG10_big_fil_rev_8_21_14_0_10_54_38]|uniref:Serine hydroxymethyltransferase n=2 Tax=Candidatus Joergenseniibacteriota TaxID=1752739 RepID=A0A2M6WG78_9BACT|nr:MAG: serine hydroxymethyltransferase [Candidatus Jorgensenbacteria bacterium CG23_combo_of_CG06-09_8_20_14_all_54_14]PIT91779.1 MAG: serine hydroxymethyltransferase [Candidatus Jorgensenbacteria bacterium CG10_big_fil_rev_8_21_14_0_10_54_38]
MIDKAVEKLIKREEARQKRVINLIASENFVSDDVLRALGSVFTNKYAEGYPGARYYGGNEVVDELENIVKARALKLFALNPLRWAVNVQPLSGSPANLAVYHALVPVGEKIMGMRLDMGGHLTHGHKVSVTGKLWTQVPYGVDRKTERLDYNALLKLAKREKPKLIVTGYTAYPRTIDFKKFRKIADAVVYPELHRRGAILMVDMSHFAGLVAGRAYPSPFKYADVVTTTTHKTLRGPRAALIFSNLKLKTYDKKRSIAEAIDKAVFPGLQGGPHENAIAAVGVALREAAQPSFRKYSRQVVKNARALAEELRKLGWRVVSGGTDTHLLLVDTMSRGMSGKVASEKLERAGIIVNKNTIPYDARKPTDPSGIRLGTPAVTTRGMKEKDMRALAYRINKVLKSV